jgi:hypothetical protein
MIFVPTPPATLAGGSLFYPDKAWDYTLLHDGVYCRVIQASVENEISIGWYTPCAKLRLGVA